MEAMTRTRHTNGWVLMVSSDLGFHVYGPFEKWPTALGWAAVMLPLPTAVYRDSALYDGPIKLDPNGDTTWELLPIVVPAYHGGA